MNRVYLGFLGRVRKAHDDLDLDNLWGVASALVDDLPQAHSFAYFKQQLDVVLSISYRTNDPNAALGKIASWYQAGNRGDLTPALEELDSITNRIGKKVPLRTLEIHLKNTETPAVRHTTSFHFPHLAPRQLHACRRVDEDPSN